MFFTVVAFASLSMLLVMSLRFVPPPTSAFMIKRQLDGLLHEDKSPRIHYQWVDWEFISPHMALAVVASEDQMFPSHWGFDFQSMAEAIEERRTKGRIRGASTISQQTVKNLFLWEGRSYVRKGFEAWFTLLMETFWPKRRILEVYLNIVEFGDGIYGVHAAATIFFDKEPTRLTGREAALMAAVLPHPKRSDVRVPSRYIQQRASQIERQMSNLGSSYLQDM
ncbi:monofunctional biosynthetic peptidoglycan transglycosylase [Desulfonatronum sp. SC1]|uniref:monofunctional biosynthetic peptidoglycan transglycosylase n=1 Tax=Desulfonatronum sp. SC1 TaxID=2109626 RepID=UPI000D319A8E|nr:monofunctional biosynthetic peptidoglycan transglycosylase [Desulfonatronum sp. SC1]PTN33926.1 monofunctional biosynthetic peptidoglycan transglycosylase [Desulfonatronum sp. SC1]